VLASGLPASAATPVERCRTVTFSPTFAKDGIVVCLTGDGKHPAMVRTSHDRGSTWGAPRKVDPASTAYAIKVVLSTEFANDDTAWVATDHGWFVSRDAATTFAAVDATPKDYMITASYVGSGGPVLMWVGRNTAPPEGYEYRRVASNDVKVPLLGVANAYVESLLLPPTYGEGGVGRVVASPFVADQTDKTGLADSGVTVHECRALLVCGTPTFSAGVRQDIVDVGETRTGESYLFTADYETLAVRVFRGRDWGATWTRWPSLEKVLAPLATRHGVPTYVLPHLSVTAAPDRPGRLFALVQNDLALLDGTLTKVSAAERHPAYELLRSDDDGAHWKRVGVSYSGVQHGTSSLPWNDSGPIANVPSLVAQPGGRLYVAAAHDRHGGYTADYVGLFTSSDNGGHWRRAIA
jgi:hypothetical protein